MAADTFALVNTTLPNSCVQCIFPMPDYGINYLNNQDARIAISPSISTFPVAIDYYLGLIVIRSPEDLIPHGMEGFTFLCLSSTDQGDYIFTLQSNG